MFKRGSLYKTRGGWEADVIWVCRFSGFYAIHKPGEENESAPIYHHNDGTAHVAFAVGEPPSYGEHPADLLPPEEL